jgi:hypothetical protein
MMTSVALVTKIGNWSSAVSPDALADIGIVTEVPVVQAPRALPAHEVCREIHREDAKSAKNAGELNYIPLTIRWMPSLIRATFQFMRQPSRCPESFKFNAWSLRALRVFAMAKSFQSIPWGRSYPDALSPRCSCSSRFYLKCECSQTGLAELLYLFLGGA